jgi:hypothetical protein
MRAKKNDADDRWKTMLVEACGTFSNHSSLINIAGFSGRC